MRAQVFALHCQTPSLAGINHAYGPSGSPIDGLVSTCNAACTCSTTDAFIAATLDNNGSVAVDSYFETSRSGIFAVGDVHGDIKLVVVAWAAERDAVRCDGGG